ncbi:MAG: hypothetical protein KAQ98_04110 [Bacteriovoracaceae bacterium]|nr:hypothetical protein [Bacteriovoracaceae bacterium]
MLNINNNNGNVSLVGILITMALLCSSLGVIIRTNNKYEKTASRAQSYLCFKYSLLQTEKYLKRMALFNTTLSVVYPLTLIPATAPKAKIVHNALKLSQNLVHLSYLKKILHSPYCSVVQSLLVVKNIPYKSIMRVYLKRKPDGTACPARKKWKMTLPEWNKHSKKISRFFLNATFKIKNKYSTKIKIKTKEVTNRAWQAWRWSHGLWSFFSS